MIERDFGRDLQKVMSAKKSARDVSGIGSLMLIAGADFFKPSFVAWDELDFQVNRPLIKLKLHGKKFENRHTSTLFVTLA